jgi:hypothetical protein
MRTLRSSKLASPVMPARRTTFDAIPPLHAASTSAHAPFALRLRVFIARGELDRQIAAGRPCESSAALARRARQLTDPRSRQRIARNLRRTVDYVDVHKSGGMISPVVIEPGAVRTGRQAILRLAQQLDGTAPVSPGGVVLARALLTDGRIPLFNPHRERSVTQAVEEVEDALEGPTRSGSTPCSVASSGAARSDAVGAGLPTVRRPNSDLPGVASPGGSIWIAAFSAA